MFYGVGFADGLVVAHWVPLRFARPPAVIVLAGLLLAAGIGLALAGVVAVLRHKTTIVPHRPVSILVTGGPYRISRNPMYTGLALAFVLLAVLRPAIRPEEDYLTSRYTDAYASYRQRVRRWL